MSNRSQLRPAEFRNARSSAVESLSLRRSGFGRFDPGRPNLGRFDPARLDPGRLATRRRGTARTRLRHVRQRPDRRAGGVAFGRLGLVAERPPIRSRPLGPKAAPFDLGNFEAFDRFRLVQAFRSRSGDSRAGDPWQVGESQFHRRLGRVGLAPNFRWAFHACRQLVASFEIAAVARLDIDPPVRQLPRLLGRVDPGLTMCWGDALEVRRPAASRQLAASRQDVVQSAAQHGVLQVRVVFYTRGELGLGVQRVRGAIFLVLAEVVMPAAQTLRVVDMPMPVKGVVVGEHRIVTVPAVVVEARIEMLAAAGVEIVVIAPVVVASARMDEQVHQQMRNVDHDAGRIVESTAQVGWLGEPNRCKHDAAPRQRAVPIPVDEHDALGRPDIMRRHPDPTLAKSVPVAGPPGVSIVPVAPISADPVVLARWRRAVRAGFEAFRRIGQVLHFLHLDRRPEPGNPLIAPARRGPVTGYPAATLRGHSPDAADVNEILPLLVPRPITRNPDYILIHRLGFRRQFFDRFRGLFGNDRRRLRIHLDWFRKRFVQRPAEQGLGDLDSPRSSGQTRLGRTTG